MTRALFARLLILAVGFSVGSGIVCGEAQEAQDTLQTQETQRTATSDSSSLPEPSYRLGEITVTAAKLTNKLGKMPASVFVVQRPEIEEQFDKTAVDILADKEGVNSGSYGSFGALQLISLRGSRFGSVPTLLDGVPINNEQNGAADLYSVPSSMIERIEVLRGPLGLLQGGNGVVGVVNFVTAEPVPKAKPVAWIGLSSGSFAYYKHLANFARYFGKVGTFFGIEGAASDGVGAYKDYSNRHYFGRFNYDFGEKRKASFLISSYSGDLRILPDARQKSDATRLQALSSIPFGENSRLELRAFHSSEKTDYRNSFGKTISELGRYGALLDFYKYETIAGDVAAGGGFTRNGLTVRDASSWSPDTWEGYVFAEDEVEIGGGLKGLLSLRSDRHSEFGTEMSPCVSVWGEMERGRVWFSSGRGFNPPTMNDLFWPRLASTWGTWTYVTEGNRRLRAEKNWMTELGSSFSFLRNSVRTGATMFAVRTTDFVSWTSVVSIAGTDSTITYVPLNTDEVTAGGLEASLDLAFRGESIFGGNVTVQRVENQKGETLPYMPGTRINLWFSKGFEPLRDLRFKLDVRATYEGKQFEPFGFRQGPFFITEGGLSASIAGFTAFARLKNATNESYPSRNLQFAPGQRGPEPVYYQMPGRNYDVGILVRLLD